MNTLGDLPWTGFKPGTSCSQSDTLPLSQRCSEEMDEFSLQYKLKRAACGNGKQRMISAENVNLT